MLNILYITGIVITGIVFCSIIAVALIFPVINETDKHKKDKDDRDT